MNDHDRDPETAPLPTLLAGRYRIVSPLGSGGMADVYLAEDERLGRPVAVKVLKARLAADDEFLERFRIEARAAASLNHPGIVAVYDRGSADGATYIAMEYVCGESLKQRLRRDGALPPDEAVTIALAVLSALAAAHARAIVHRDVTSYNVMLEEGGRVVVTDFGIARMGDSALTRTGAMMGTSSYLSPEQAQGRQADERSDLYSLGVVLYEMLTGRVPFRGETDVAVAMQHVSTAPPNPRTLSPGVSEALAGVVMRALSKDPADRYQSADEFAAALRTARRPVRPPAVTACPPPARSPSRRGGDGRAAGAGLLATGAGSPPRPGARQRHAGRPSPQRSRPGRRPVAVGGAGARPGDRGRRGGADPLPLGRRAGDQRPPAPARARAPRRARRGPARRGRRRGVGRLRLPARPRRDRPGRGRRAARGRDERRARRGPEARAPLRLVGQVRIRRGRAAVAPRRRQGRRRGQGRPLGEPRAAAHPVARPHRAGGRASLADGCEAQSLNSKSRRAASETAPKGEIFRQEPAAGETVRRGDTVTFWVSSGPPEVYVPDVVGYSQGDASALLEDAGFVVSTDYVAGWGEIPGTVVGQDPVADVKGRVGDEVVIQVAIF